MLFTRTLLIIGLTVAVAGCTASTTQVKPTETVHKTLTSTQPAPANTMVQVQNLAGHVTVQQGGTQLKVTATVVAGGKDQAAAQALADTIKLSVQRAAGTLTVHVHYPVDRYQSFHYIPTKVDTSNSAGLQILGFNISHSSSSTGIKYQQQKVSVYQGKDKGVPLHVDLVVSLPAGSRADIRNHFGLIQADSLNGDLTLDNDAGDIHASHIKGKLNIKSDSGDAIIADVQGMLSVETDAGDVDASNIQGNSNIQVDAGDISARNMHGDRLKLDTDAGDIQVTDASGTMHIDSDAGDITLKNLGVVPHLAVDSDLGDIHISGDLSGVASFKIGTDAGDITLATTQPPAVRLDIKGSDVRVQWPSLHDVQSSGSHFAGSVGKATGQGSIHTDLGDVVLKQ